MRTGSVAPNSEIAQVGSIVFSPKRMPVCRYVNILSKKSVTTTENGVSIGQSTRGTNCVIHQIDKCVHTDFGMHCTLCE